MAKEQPKKPKLTPAQEDMVRQATGDDAPLTGDRPAQVEPDLEARVARLEALIEQAMRTPNRAPVTQNVFDSGKAPVPMPAPGWRDPAPAADEPETVEMIRTFVDAKGETRITDKRNVVVLGREQDVIVVAWPIAGPQKFDTDTGEAHAPSLRDWHLGTLGD